MTAANVAVVVIDFINSVPGDSKYEPPLKHFGIFLHVVGLCK